MHHLHTGRDPLDALCDCMLQTPLWSMPETLVELSTGQANRGIAGALASSKQQQYSKTGLLGPVVVYCCCLLLTVCLVTAAALKIWCLS